MIETLSSFLIIAILESLSLKSLGNISIASKKTKTIFDNSKSLILAEKKKIIQKIKKYHNEKLWNAGLYFASKLGDQEMIDIFISKGANNWDCGMSGAANGGYQHLVEFFISKGANVR